jgi:RNA polymerase sigma-70 factor (ECF subfamily)
LLTRHKNQLFNFIFCLVQSLPDAEDVFQQSTIAMWDRFGQFLPGSDFLAWASCIARYRALNLLRARRRERVCFSEDLVNQFTDRVFDRPDVHEARLKALAACRGKLSAADQELLAACYGGKGTIREAAQLIGRPVGPVYDSLSRIRRALFACIRRTLASEGYV